MKQRVKHRTSRFALVIVVAAAATLGSCSKADDLTALPDGKCPLTLATTIQSDISTARVTEDTSGESQWSGDETVKVNVQTGELGEYHYSYDGFGRAILAF